MKNVFLFTLLTLVSFNIYAVPKCWFEDSSPKGGGPVLVDGRFFVNAKDFSVLDSDILKIVKKELKVISVFKKLMIEIQAEKKQHETRQEMKLRVEGFLDQLITDFPQLKVSCKWLYFPGFSGHNMLQEVY